MGVAMDDGGAHVGQFWNGPLVCGEIVMTASPSTAKCIYCHERKPLSAFDAGHVIPQAFGKFEDNLVLTAMECIDCNSYFGKHLELALARDTAEGLDRFEHDVVKSKKGRRRVIPAERIKFTVADGPFAGAPLEPDPDAPPDRFLLRPVRVIGFCPKAEGPYEWFDPEKLPPLDDLRALGPYVTAAASMSPDELNEILTAIGMPLGEQTILSDPRDPDGKLATTVRGRIDKTIKRAVAKIAFSYLAHEYPGFPFMEQFDEIRRYVRWDVEPSFDPIQVSMEPVIGNVPDDIQLVAHAVTVRWDRRRGRVIAQVTLFGRLQYKVTLSNSRFIFKPTCIDAGHAFNTYGRQVSPLTRNRRLAAKRLPLMTKEEFLKAKAEPTSQPSAS